MNVNAHIKLVQLRLFTLILAGRTGPARLQQQDYRDAEIAVIFNVTGTLADLVRLLLSLSVNFEPEISRYHSRPFRLSSLPNAAVELSV